MKTQFQVTQAVSSGERPNRPIGLHSQARGLTDSVWEIMVACWDQLPEKRLSASQAVQRLGGLPGLPIDSRPLDDYSLPPSLRTTCTQIPHLSAILESVADSERETGGDGVDVPFEKSFASLASDLIWNDRMMSTDLHEASLALSVGEGLSEAPLPLSASQPGVPLVASRFGGQAQHDLPSASLTDSKSIRLKQHREQQDADPNIHSVLPAGISLSKSQAPSPPSTDQPEEDNVIPVDTMENTLAGDQRSRATRNPFDYAAFYSKKSHKFFTCWDTLKEGAKLWCCSTRPNIG
ncbi:hypothetical protein HWV62_10046 [Athelia sp. TMB]|nr:hypothetical protein HWV62_10046 [Athelia sp. TMB]